MNTVKLLVLFVVLTTFSLPALACRGTAEYPELASTINQKLESSSLSSEEKAQVKSSFLLGMKEHSKAHENNSMSQMKGSLRTLDKTKAIISGD